MNKMLLLLAAVLTSACAHGPSHKLDRTQFIPGETTSTEVQRALGKPEDMIIQPNGEYAFFYFARTNGNVAFLFGKNGKLIKVEGYGENVQAK
jgi:hypothetical protein